MDKRLKIIAELYEKRVGDPNEPAVHVDPDLQHEYAIIADMKSRLDARPGQVPDPGIVEAVIRSANNSGSQPRRNHDRPAVPGKHMNSKRLRLWAGALASVIVIISLAWLVIPEFDLSGESSIAEYRDPAVPGWDDADDLRSLYWRIEALRMGSEGISWDEPGIPLEYIPLNGGSAVPFRQEASVER